MSRLIEADVAIENIEEWLNSVGTALIGKGLSYTGELMGCIEDAPTVDAVPVVRCRECKHHRDKNEQEQQYLVEDILICTSPDVTDDCWSAVWPDHFCSYGERKEGADNG